jgi:hypothetical protein
MFGSFQNYHKKIYSIYRVKNLSLESLILAQDERLRRA